MTNDNAMTTHVQPSADLNKIKETMGRNEVLLSAKTQTMVNQLKDLSRHFYSVGKFKAPDGTWQDKMEPDAFAVQTMATLQSINTEVISMTWETPDDLFNAAVTVRVKGWKGPKNNPTIEKTVELRLSMKAIAAKYVADKIEPKKKWNDASRRKEEMPAEWNEADVTLLDNGWIQPKSYKHQVSMRSFLIDQFNFLPRMAESKAERRVNLKLLGFDWRDPDEITDEGGERAAVAATKEQTADPAPILAQLEACSSLSDLDALNPFLTVELGKLSDADQRRVMEEVKKKRAALSVKPRPDMSDKVVNHRDGNPTNNEISNLEIVDAPAPAEPPAMPEMEFDSWVDGMKAQETVAGVDDVYNQAFTKPMSLFQRSTLDIFREACLKQLEKPKVKKKAA